MNVRRRLFLSLGLERVYPPQERERAKDATEKLSEPDASKAYRRNILALAGVVVVAGFAGADPRDIAVFGVKPAEDRGVLVLGLAVILVHVYWYVLRYHHLKEDGVVEPDPGANPNGLRQLKISWNDFRLVRKSADLWSNYVTVTLTVVSWCVVGSWICNGG